MRLKFSVDVYHHYPTLVGLEQEMEFMSANMDRLIAEVVETRGAVDSAIVAIAGIRQQLADAGTDQAKLAELADSLDAAQADLAAAVAAPGVEAPAEPAA